ncbi:MAG: dTMP kinase [Alphaproteobacteria bacterium]
MARGRFITFEGGEGAGKSTQVARLVAALDGAGIATVRTREPGGSPGADAIRALLVTGETDRWDATSELLLHAAARRDHLVRTVWPALEAGRWVVSDRFADSTMAYQGSGHGLSRVAVATVHGLIAGEFAPDLTLILDLPVEQGLARAATRQGAETRYERMDIAFHERLRAGFLDIARREPGRCVVIDATASVDAVAAQVAAAVGARLSIRLAAP